MADRKIRTREHVIAAMSLHHVAYIVAKAGYALDIPIADYGVDGLITTFDTNGNIESGAISLQLKATDHLGTRSDGRIAVRLDLRDIDFWLENFFPVIVVMFDARSETGYYLIVQEYFKAHPLTAAQRQRTALTVHIDPGAVVSDSAVRSWRDLKISYRKAWA